MPTEELQAMKTKNDIMRILKEELPQLRNKYGIKTIGLFGSYSREEQGMESDVDILVQFEKPVGFFKFIAMEEYLKERIGENVEIVTEDALKPYIKPGVLKDVVYVEGA